MGIHSCSKIKLSMQPATLANCLKIIDFFPDRNVPDYEECGSFKFHDATLTLGPVFTFASNYYQTASFLTHRGHSNRKKNTTIFGRLASEAILFARFHAGTRNSLSDIWRIKFVLILLDAAMDIEHSSSVFQFFAETVKSIWNSFTCLCNNWKMQSRKPLLSIVNFCTNNNVTFDSRVILTNRMVIVVFVKFWIIDITFHLGFYVQTNLKLQ